MASPFVQGQLRGEPLSVVIDTVCAHCAQTIRFEIDSDLKFRVETQGADPVIFVPAVNFSKISDASIIDVF